MQLVKLIIFLQLILSLKDPIFGQGNSKSLVLEFTPQQWNVLSSYKAHFEEDQFQLRSWRSWSPSLGVNFFWDKSKWSYGIGMNLFYSSDNIFVNYIEKRNQFLGLERDLDGFYSLSQFVSGLHFCLRKNKRRLNYWLKIGLQNSNVIWLSKTDDETKIYYTYLVNNGELQSTRRAILEKSFNNKSSFCSLMEWNILFQINKRWGIGLSCSYRYFIQKKHNPFMTLTVYMDDDFLELPRADIPKIFETQFAPYGLYSGFCLTYSFHIEPKTNEQLKEGE